jgi:hypothetical protein
VKKIVSPDDLSSKVGATAERERERQREEEVKIEFKKLRIVIHKIFP